MHLQQVTRDGSRRKMERAKQCTRPPTSTRSHTLKSRAQELEEEEPCMRVTFLDEDTHELAKRRDIATPQASHAFDVPDACAHTDTETQRHSKRHRGYRGQDRGRAEAETERGREGDGDSESMPRNCISSCLVPASLPPSFSHFSLFSPPHVVGVVWSL